MKVRDDFQYPLRAMVRFDFEDLTAGEGEPFHKLPPGGVVTGGAVVVETPWNSGTSADLTVGDSDSSDRYTSSAVDLTTEGRTAFDLDGHQYTTPDELIATLAEDGSEATEGEGFIELEVVIEDRANEAVS